MAGGSAADTEGIKEARRLHCDPGLWCPYSWGPPCSQALRYSGRILVSATSYSPRSREQATNRSAEAYYQMCG
jgi:hypothetical protein